MVPALPLKPQYGPTLGTLLAPRWRAARRVTRAVVILAGVGLLVLAAGVVLTLLDSTYSHGGRVPFSFKYKGLYLTTPNPGGYVKVARGAGAQQEDSYAVAPLVVAPYKGSVTGALPLAAVFYTHTLAGRFADFRIEGEGKTRISSSLQGYQVLYSALVAGRKMYGRDVMLLPTKQGAREGVVIEMLSTEEATPSAPVGNSGVLETPLKTFSFG